MNDSTAIPRGEPAIRTIAMPADASFVFVALDQGGRPRVISPGSQSAANT